jgi:hypothetical protein
MTHQAFLVHRHVSDPPAPGERGCRPAVLGGRRRRKDRRLRREAVTTSACSANPPATPVGQRQPRRHGHAGRVPMRPESPADRWIGAGGAPCTIAICIMQESFGRAPIAASAGPAGSLVAGDRNVANAMARRDVTGG